jgi:DNA polymerase III alpha subunit (gram-positive type)
MDQGRKALRQLFTEVGLPPEWLERELAHARIKEVRVDQAKRTWHVHLHAGEPLEPEIWQTLQQRVRQHFEPEVKVSFFFQYDRLNHEVVLAKYRFWIQKWIEQAHTPAAATWFGQAEWRVERQQIEVVFANPAVWQMARERELDSLIAKYYRRITGQEVPVRLTFRGERGTDHP